MTISALLVENISRFYESGKIKIKALDSLSFTLAAGAQVALTGPSGSGKTTLLSLLGALEQTSLGTITVFGRDLGKMSESQAAAFRRRNVGFIFQDDALMPELTVAENVALPLVLTGVSNREIKLRVAGTLARLQLEKLAHSFPGALSGGEKQRIAVARAVIHRPQLLLADEPTANLDRRAADLVLDTITRLSSEVGLTMIMATHDPRVYNRMPQRLELIDGRLADIRVS